MDVKNIPDYKSNESQWQAWHKSLIEAFGKTDADILLIKALAKRWKQGSKSTTFIDYLQSQNIPVELSIWESMKDVSSDAGATLLAQAKKIKGIGDSVLDTISSVIGVGKYVVIGIAVITIGGLAMIVYNIAKNPIAAANTASKFTPAGGTASAMGK